MIPPAVIDVPNLAPPIQGSNDAQGYDEVRPDDDTTPMAVILGGGSLVQQPAAMPAKRDDEPAAPKDAPPRAAGVRKGQRQGAQAPAVPAGAPDQRMRGPFEPPEKSDPVGDGVASSRRTPQAGPGGDAGRRDSAGGATISDAARASVSSPAATKMDQIKDLYLTAEAIGEDALDQNFDLVSDRQRQLIREYFNQLGVGRADSHDAAS
jgi:hypothetical protein